jgi:hypothetical protein
LIKILLVERLGVLDVGMNFFGGLVAANSGMTIAVDVAVCYVTATDEGLQLPSLLRVRYWFNNVSEVSYPSNLDGMVVCH